MSDPLLTEELGRLTAETDEVAAVEVYCSFPFSTDEDFDQNVLRIHAVKLMLKLGMYADERLKGFLIRRRAQALYLCSYIGIVLPDQATRSSPTLLLLYWYSTS